MRPDGVQRLLSLPPAPDSARQARRYVAEVLTGVGAEQFIDSAVLLTSELVTNAIVHAHTDIAVVVSATYRWVRVEVSDHNPHLPSRREYDENAMTGRGLEMVELLADDFGISAAGAEGKCVWFRLGAAPPEPSEHVEPVEDENCVAVRMLTVPVALYCAWQQHADALLREATLATLDDSDSPVSDFRLAGEALGTLADAAAELFALREDDVSVADVTLTIRREAVAGFPVLREVLRDAAQRSLDGYLLVPPSLPEIQAVRDWVCDEVPRQAAGLPPEPWRGIESEGPAGPTLSAESIDAIRGSALAQVASDQYNRVVAVSRPAAELLGWPALELEGRRLVALIPARLRDAHIAGFTRHMLGGPSRILGAPVLVPALRRDGNEVEVTLLIERRTDASHQPLFIATLTPVAD